jgi:hypothetical protein
VNQQIRDDGDLRRYRTEVPNMADDELDPYQMRLYVHYKRVCGAGADGACWESVDTTAERCKMSAGMVVKTRCQLVEMGYISVEKGANRNSTCTVTINDQWAENMNRYVQKRSPDEHSVHVVSDSVHGMKQRSNVVKNKPNKKTADRTQPAIQAPPPPPRPAAASNKITAVISAFSQTLTNPLTGIPDLARQLQQQQKTLAEVNEVIQACQAATNPAGAFISYVKTGFVPRPRTVPKPSKPTYRQGADGVIEVWTGNGWGKAYGVGREVLA